MKGVWKSLYPQFIDNFERFNEHEKITQYKTK